MTDLELSAWLRLAALPRAAVRRLLSDFGSPEAVLEAPRANVAAAVGQEVATTLARSSPAHDALLGATTAWLGSEGQRALIPLGDPRYPPLLLVAADPPLLLYAHGDPALLQAPTIAIVGSRHPTPQGLENAKAFAAYLGGEGWAIVSGLALGIDAAAHAGALDAGAATIAVVGTGLDRIYPPSNAVLARRIAEFGLLLSDFPIGTPPLPHHFPMRNRLIAGLSRGTLVVEAALRSGSLITAKLAAEAGREVFAIPGSIHAPQARGCHALIKQGAKLVESGADLLEELPGGPTPAVEKGGQAKRPSDAVGRRKRPDDAGRTPSPTANRARDTLLDAMGHDPISLDELVARTGVSPAELSGRLLDLELAGQVARLPGQRFQRMGRA